MIDPNDEQIKMTSIRGTNKGRNTEHSEIKKDSIKREDISTLNVLQ